MRERRNLFERVGEPSADLALFEAHVALARKQVISTLEKLGISHLVGQIPLIDAAFLGFCLCLTTPSQPKQRLTATLNVHGLTGMLAIVLMLVHAVWATYTYFRGSEKAQERFHKKSPWRHA